MKIHQLIPVLHAKDAMGNQAIAFQKLLCEWGYQSFIYAAEGPPDLKDKWRHHHAYEDSDDSILIYHYGITYDPFVELVPSLSSRIAIYYHNITPAHYFEMINPEIALALRRSREEIATLSNVASNVLTASQYSQQELQNLGYQDVTVLPPLFGFTDLNIIPNQSILRRYGNGQTNILFVGRVTPNKRYDDLIRVFAYYQRWIDATARLIFVGTSSGTEVYVYWLKELAQKLGVNNIIWAGHVSQDELVAYYKTASVFVCLSDHEGFCIPLLEAMRFDVPIIAYKSSAIPDTLGSAGVLVTEKRYEVIAELIGLLNNDSQLRHNVIVKQRERLAEFSVENLIKKFRQWVTNVTIQR